ncbi:Pcl10p NDAI_0I00860 [Naumovozyma dairenensis CBS 421]|uniref:Uncharacterized protein n=1 Tax=Naumovozyma dairenensis (strain ATCC 10597 / BCRC 20456 / CBS 421 / NBRC 0211 / NRRL Y-12639) TaxID=1071378 RepID=G0WFU4_NAUDC|nr:hypothetical protein NDAI_0I00860 [Naumovozyma dairenensis CBS 421]CCD26655.1 hypothetical protein NDAI_0I00860 [Naumovozyma dairenensis CBS 421]
MSDQEGERNNGTTAIEQRIPSKLDLNQVSDGNFDIDMDLFYHEIRRPFQLPLNPDFLKSNNNFSELSDGLNSTTGSTPFNLLNNDTIKDVYDDRNEKKVRFNDNYGEAGEDGLNTIMAPNPTKLMSRNMNNDDHDGNDNYNHNHHHHGKKDVEDLLRSASQVNNYITENLEKIDTFRKDLLSEKSLYRIFDDTPTTRPSTRSTFGDTNIDSMDSLITTSHHSRTNIFSHMSMSQFESRSRSRSPSLSPPPMIRSNSHEIENHLRVASPFNLSRSISRQNNNTNNTLDNHNFFMNKNDSLIDGIDTISNDISNFSIQHSPEFNHETLQFENLEKPIKRILSSHNSNGTTDEDTSLLSADALNKYSNDFIEIPPQEALNNLKETFSIFLKLSKNDIQENEAASDSTMIRYSNFKMKSLPSLTFELYLDRIHTKCEYDSHIYLIATYLLQTLFLERDSTSNSLKLKMKLESTETHRLIIATIRISTKLLEDHVHSHEYFCKVCGISKKLLSKLEISLLLCLKNEKLLMTKNKMIASILILKELRTI